MTTTITETGKRFLAKQFSKWATTLEPDVTVTLEEVCNGAWFRCPTCDVGCDLEREWDLTVLDAITFELPCGHGLTFRNPTGDETIPGVKYAKHD